MERDIEVAFNNALQIKGNGILDPKFFRIVESRLKLKHDKRYKLFALAATDDSCIIKYMNQKYYVKYSLKRRGYEAEAIK